MISTFLIKLLKITKTKVGPNQIMWEFGIAQKFDFWLTIRKCLHATKMIPRPGLDRKIRFPPIELVKKVFPKKS